MWSWDKGLDVFEGFTFDEPDDATKLQIVIKKFEEYGAPRKKHIMAALKFNESCQGDNESFETFVADLKILENDCGYKDEERMVRDAIVFREKCIDLADTWTLEKVIEIGRNHETNLSCLKKLAKDEDPNVNAINKGRYLQRVPPNRRYLSKDKSYKRNTESEKDKCGRCGQKCPTIGQQCGYCKKMNHYERICRAKPLSSQTAGRRRLFIPLCLLGWVNLST